MSTTGAAGEADWDLLPDGILLADANGIVTRANRAARLELQLTGDPVGRALSEVMALSDLAGNRWYDVVAPYDGIVTRIGVPEQSWVLPGGGEVLVVTRLIRERGKPVTSVAVVLRDARGRERLDRERSDLVATVAHELRSPLTGLRGFVTTLLGRWQQFTDDQRLLMLQTVNHDAERLGRLITELLDAARIDTGRLPLYPRPVEVVPLIERVIASVGVTTTRKITLDGDAWLRVNADPDKLTQVLTNLIENGVRHGDGEVHVIATAPDGDPDHVRITIDDQGDGIPEEIRRRVFTKFWRSGESGGSGLGMYIVNGLVRAHGGSLSIGDAPGGGARITLLWPVPE